MTINEVISKFSMLNKENINMYMYYKIFNIHILSNQIRLLQAHIILTHVSEQRKLEQYNYDFINVLIHIFHIK